MIFRRVAPALLAALFALALPSAAAAAAYVVDNTGDLPSGPGVACGNGEGCSLRAAIQAANADSVKDTIGFDATVFKGDAASTIALGSSLPAIIQPAAVDGGTCASGGGDVPCVTIKGISNVATLTVEADESTVEHLKFEGGRIGAHVRAQGDSGPGVEILENTFTGFEIAIASVGAIGGSGNLIEGNEIDVPADLGFTGIHIRNGPNRVYGNVIDGEGSWFAGIWLQDTASGNRIGGDTEASENVISGFQNGAITLALPESTRNEIGRNRGENDGRFISLSSDSPNGGIQPPAIGSLLRSSASGTAQPGAKIRIFRKATAGAGEIAGFLGEAVADPSGNWKASFAAVPVGTFATATQTLDGGTSELAAIATAAADPPTPTCADTPAMCLKPETPGSPAPQPVPDTTAPTVTIKKAPKAKTINTTAKFKFVSDEPGSKFQCKLDKGKFKSCRSPKTYKKLKPGKHDFKVRAVDIAGNVGKPAKRTFTVLG